MNWLLLTAILLSWNSQPQVDSYNVKITAPNFNQTVSTPVNSQALSLNSGAKFTFVVSAKNIVGTSPGSIPVSFTPGLMLNISTRAFVGTGDNVMIAGFIIGGATPRTVVVRAIGPSLPINGVLQDPSLTLSDGESNDNWKDAANHNQIPSNLLPGNDKESAILTTLQPGAYTAIVRGVNNTTGLALVEVYDITQ